MTEELEMRTEPCYNGAIAETKRVNHDTMTIEEIECSRCARYSISNTCFKYVTLKHMTDFNKLFSF